MARISPMLAKTISLLSQFKYNHYIVLLLCILSFISQTVAFGISVPRSTRCSQIGVQVAFDIMASCDWRLAQISIRILGLTSDNYTHVCSDFHAYVECMERSFACSEVVKEFEQSYVAYTGDPFYCHLNNTDFMDVLQQQATGGGTGGGGGGHELPGYSFDHFDSSASLSPTIHTGHFSTFPMWSWSVLTVFFYYYHTRS